MRLNVNKITMTMQPDWEIEGIEETTGRWNPEVKERWLLKRLYEIAKRKGNNTFEVYLEDVMSPVEWLDDPPNDDPFVLFYAEEQHNLLEIFSLKNIISIEGETDPKHLVVRLIEKERPQHSMYYKDSIRTIQDVLLNAELRESLRGIIRRAYGFSDERELSKRHVKIEFNERGDDGSYQDEKILLLEELGVTKADWEGMMRQTHRTVGNRLISVYFNGDKVGEFIDFIRGKKSFIDLRVLKLIVERLLKTQPNWSGDSWSDFLIENGVPTSLFSSGDFNTPMTDWIYGILLPLCSTGEDRHRQIVEKILSETIHPLFYHGDEVTASMHKQELNRLLKFSNLVLRGGHLISTAAEPLQEKPASPTKPIIRAKAIEQLSWLIKDMMTEHQLRNLFSNAGVSGSIIPTEAGSKQKLVYGVLNTLSTSATEESKALLFHILEEVSHPLYSGNDVERAQEIQINITKMIRYDGLSIIGNFMHSFNKKDEVTIAKFDEESKKIDPALAESLNGLFGGIFSSPTAPKVNTKPSPSVETRETHIHIHNANQITQNMQLSDAASELKKDVGKTRKTLKDTEISFDDDTATIQINGIDCKLPPITNQHLFCRAMFQYRQGEAVDWSVISEVMTGKKWVESTDEATKADRQAVRDAMYAVNKRVGEVYGTDDKLFSMVEKSVCRAY